MAKLSATRSSRTQTFAFPMPRTHTGVLQGNGTLGLIIWGEGSTLRLTVGRADFWDHRGGMPWREGMSYTAIRKLLEAGDEPGLRALFETTAQKAGEPRRPTVLPVGRLDLEFGTGAVLQDAVLDVDSGQLRVHLHAAGRTHELRIAVAMGAPAAAVLFPRRLPLPRLLDVPSWEYVGAELAGIGFQPPQRLSGSSLGGWVQARPADPALCVGHRFHEHALLLTAVYADTDTAGAAGAAAAAALDEITATGGARALETAAVAWWQAYWQRVPRLEVGNPRLQFLYDYGMYKFGSFTQPAGVPASLQGPWIEEYRLPPWSSDYHFNINVQMCYWPAYHGNCLSHLLPLFRMVNSWLPVLRENARVFLGINDGLMLPHAVDDRGTCMGGFWTGSVDHACTGWVAQMMYRYYRYTLDRDFLRDLAYPFMLGAMRVFEAMLERDGDRLVLPVSVSPEYRGSAMNAWGRNASFQLACIHRLCADLLAAAGELQQPLRPAWLQIQARLPRASLLGTPGRESIGLWDSLRLEESHRHHSHLAGITPFDVFPAEPQWRGIVARSLDEWVRLGQGLWSGWAVPWASMIHSRCDNGDAAEWLLEWFDRVFCTSGFGTLHDVDFPGLSLMGRTYTNPAGRGDIMQMDGGMCSAAAVQEMLLHTRQGVHHVFPAVPRRWRHAAFGPMRTDGAFLVSGSWEDRRVARLEINSPHGGLFRLANPWPAGTAVVVERAGATQHLQGEVVAVPTAPGEVLHICGGR